MPSVIFFTILIMHALIHFMGFAKAFQYSELKQLTMPISKNMGVVWLLAAFVLLISSVFFLLKKEYWIWIVFVGIVLSQWAIINSWKDARYGTIANIIILLVAVLSYTSQRFENSFRLDVKNQMKKVSFNANDLITEEDIKLLPVIVQKYLSFSSVIGKPKLKNMRIVFEGKMRDKGKDYFSFRSEQYNYFDEPSRLFFMKGKMFGITVPGYHYYINTKAVMDIRLFGLFSLVKYSGEIMDKTETVTLFNDMCLMAPASLIDKHIVWNEINDTTVLAKFTNRHITISATLFFNRQGQLLNFISNDRTAVSEMKSYPFSTPVLEYQKINGMNVIKRGNAVWQYPEGDFIYGEFNLKEIEFNVVK